MPRVHAFTDDALADRDAVATAELIRRGEITAAEATDAAIARVERVASELAPVAYPAYAAAREHARRPRSGRLGGVPFLVKDNTDVAGMPTNHGTEAFTARPATANSVVTDQLLHSGMTVLGKTRLPEFGFNASTEFATAEPVRNPWDTEYSCGASSGGSAALVAAGAVPVAHANDGGGSIRIPAACCGLVGLKPSRGRLADGPQARMMPVNLVSEGLLSRSVRDTAAFLAAAEEYRPSRALPAVGHVRSPGDRRLRIGLVLDSISGTPTDAETRDAVRATATRLEKLGHRVEPVPVPVSSGFVRDFTVYWGLLSFLVTTFGRRAMSPEFDASKLDGLTRGLYELYRRHVPSTLGVLYRFRRVRRSYAAAFAGLDLVFSPTLGHTPPRLGHLSPNVEFEELLRRLTRYVAFTPLNNVAGGPAISVPIGRSAGGLPIGGHFSAAHGDERTLLEIAYALEAEQPWPRIDQV